MGSRVDNEPGKHFATDYFTLAVLTNMGEKMSDEEVDELLKNVDTSNGEINYVGRLLTRCPSKVRTRTDTQSTM